MCLMWFKKSEIKNNVTPSGFMFNYYTYFL